MKEEKQNTEASGGSPSDAIAHLVNDEIKKISRHDFRDRISKLRLRTKYVYIPELDCHVKFKGLRYGDRQWVRNKSRVKEIDDQTKLVTTRIDDEKTQIYTIIRASEDPKFDPEEDYDLFEELTLGTALMLLNEIHKLSGLSIGQEEEKEAKGDDTPVDFTGPLSSE